MTDVALTADGRLAVSGDLLFDHAVEACAAGRALIAAHAGPVVEVSLAGLRRINSVSAVVLLEWQRAAAAAGKTLRIRDVPPRLAGMLRLSGLETVLPVSP